MMRLNKLLLLASMQSIAYSEVFDFIIIGGGAAGLTVASRLADISNISILLLEAGKDHTSDVSVECPRCFATLYGNPEYDWDYDNVPQVRYA